MTHIRTHTHTHSHDRAKFIRSISLMCRKREEKMKRVHEKQAELQKVEEQKKRKIAGQRTKQEQLKEKVTTTMREGGGEWRFGD